MYRGWNIPLPLLTHPSAVIPQRLSSPCLRSVTTAFLARKYSGSVVTSGVGLEREDITSHSFFSRENVKNFQENSLFNELAEIPSLLCVPLKFLEIPCVGYIWNLLVCVVKGLFEGSLEFVMIFATFFPGSKSSCSDTCFFCGANKNLSVWKPPGELLSSLKSKGAQSCQDQRFCLTSAFDSEYSAGACANRPACVKARANSSCLLLLGPRVSPSSGSHRRNNLLLIMSFHVFLTRFQTGLGRNCDYVLKQPHLKLWSGKITNGDLSKFCGAWILINTLLLLKRGTQLLNHWRRYKSFLNKQPQILLHCFP